MPQNPCFVNGFDSERHETMFRKKKSKSRIFLKKVFERHVKNGGVYIEEKKFKKVLDKMGYMVYNNPRCQRESNGNERSLKTI